jgi:hypothetical protein
MAPHRLEPTGARSDWLESNVAKSRRGSFRELHDVPGSGVMHLEVSRTEALAAVGPVVYALRCGDTIKIGHTKNLVWRIYKLHADELLAFRPGVLEDEQAIHADLLEHLHHGREWYRPTPAVMAVVNEMRAELGLDPVAA